MAEALAIEVEGLAELDQRLGTATSNAVLRPAMAASTMLIHDRVAVYPPQAHRSMRFKSDEQRQFFFAALRDGRIQVPYRRTGTLGRRWTTRVEVTATNLVGTVGNNTAYGPFVMDRKDQAMIHQGVWPVFQTVAEQAMPGVLSVFQQAVQVALAGGG